MTIYYTAKDIEEMAARGIQQLEVGPGITLTDFARETARQLDIKLVKLSQQPAQTVAAASPTVVSRSSTTPLGAADKYNKPAGCQHGSIVSPAVPPAQKNVSGDSTTVDKLIDLMGKVIKRGD